MDQKQLVKQVIEVNQTTFNTTFDAMVLLQDQFESIANAALNQFSSFGLPAEGRKAIESWAEAFKESRKNFKQHIDRGFEQAEKLFVI